MRARLRSATYHTYRIAGLRDTHLSDLATMVLTVQVLVIGLCFTGPRVQHADGHRLLAAQRVRVRRPAHGVPVEQQALDDETADGESDDAHAEDPH